MNDDAIAAAGPWRHDVEDAPRGVDLLCQWDGFLAVGWKLDQNEWFSGPDSLGTPIAYAEITAPEARS